LGGTQADMSLAKSDSFRLAEEGSQSTRGLGSWLSDVGFGGRGFEEPFWREARAA
jgi:hypothetical protein